MWQLGKIEDFHFLSSLLEPTNPFIKMDKKKKNKLEGINLPEYCLLTANVFLVGGLILTKSILALLIFTVFWGATGVVLWILEKNDI